MSRPLTISFFGVTIPIPPWTVGGFGVVALAGVSGSVYRHVFPPPVDTAERVAAKEYETHLNETPNKIYEHDGVTLRVYPDQCLLIAQRVGDRVFTKLVPSLAREEWSHPPVPFRVSSLFTATLYAQGRCQNPHPGEFETTYGAKNGCWVEVVRRWRDGCEHVQMLNSCSGAWDANADGSPRVRWTRCQH